jgi:hypothetical protein
MFLFNRTVNLRAARSIVRTRHTGSSGTMFGAEVLFDLIDGNIGISRECLGMGHIRSKSTLIAAFLAAEIAAVVLPEFRARPAPVPRGMLYASAQGRSVSPDRTAALNSRARSSGAHGRASTAHDTAPRSIDGR